MRPAAGAPLLAALASVLLVTGAPGQVSVVEWEGGGLDLGGYARTLTAVHDLRVDPPAGFDRRSAFAGQVVRLKWTARGGGSGGWVLEVHDRVQARVTSSASSAAGGTVVGFGVSAVPDRTIDLESTLIEEDRFRVWHDLDRLALTLYTDAADITLGRQAVTWGLSALFPVADLWSRFSPFELDTEEKPGIDAVRVLAYPSEGMELDAVLADRGSLDDLSAGVRATWSLPSGDLWIGVGKFWREAIALAGGSVLLEDVKLRAEGALPWEVDDEGGDGEDGLADPRITVGADWISGRWVVSGELHFNGVGTGETGDYLARLTSDPRLARGETYYLGRWYAGALASWQAADRVTLAATALVNLEDPSMALTPGLTWDVGQSARLSLGGLVPFGDPLGFGPGGLPSFRTEFGAYGALGWTQVSVYF